MKFKNLFAILLCLCLLLASGCQDDIPPETTPPTNPPETTVPTTAPPDPADIYNAAIEALGTDAVKMIATISKTVTVAGQTFSSESDLNLDYWNIGTDDFLANVKQTVDFDQYLYKLEEVYSSGNVYQTVGPGKFTSHMESEDFTARYPEIALLDPALYTVTLENDGSVIRFSDATSVEEWLGGEEAELISAEGSLTLDSNGAAKIMKFDTQFRLGAGEFDIHYTVEYAASTQKPELPSDADTYVTLTDIDGGWLMDEAYGYLLQAQQFSTGFLDTIQSQAAGFVVNTQQTVDSYVTDKGIDYLIETSVYAMDASTTEEVTNTERFIDGQYTIEADGEEPETIPSVTADTIKSAASSILTGNITETDVFTDAEITNLGSLILVEYSCTEEFAKSIEQSISATYLGDPQLLDNLASSYKTNTMELYLALDAYTMLPTSVGYLYEGCHVIEGQEYLLISQSDQSFDLASLTSHDAIYEEPIPDVEPETKATPLFNHVTGTDGEEMWLFGTIHVGDDRTAYLPAEITDALLSSEALAVECDIDGFDEQLEEDEKLQEEVSGYYFYTDGTIADHLDTEDLYEDARKALRATGSYFFNSEYQKASVWSSSIDNYYLSQGHHLLSEKGVESRLEKIAEENDIPLWEVESSLFQIQMLNGYSDHLQEFQLYSSVYSHGKENWESTAELYELWCSGDEAALIEEFIREPWTITEEDLAEWESEEGLEEEDLEDIKKVRENLAQINTDLDTIYQEYVNSMEISRNARMLEVAKEYLQSGKTVFYAVGLAHLLAEDGLVNTLRDAGYTVELVSFN